jgi:TonB family protein
MYKNIFAACLVISIGFHIIIAAFVISYKPVPKNISAVFVQEVSLVGNLKFGTDAVHTPKSNKSFLSILRPKQNETTSRMESLHSRSNYSETPKAIETKADSPSERSQPGSSSKPVSEEGRVKDAPSSGLSGIGIGSGTGENKYTQAGSAVTDTKDGIIKARLVNQPDIRYDETSRMRGEEGEVSIRLEIDRSGNPRNVKIGKSSGFPRLDRVALNGIRSSRFSPTLKSGRPVDSEIEYTIIFWLDDRHSSLKVVEDDKVNILE